MIIANLIPINIIAFENAFEYKGILIALNMIILTFLTAMGFIAINSNKNKEHKLQVKKGESKNIPNITYNTTINYDGKEQTNQRNKFLRDLDNYNGLDKWI